MADTPGGADVTDFSKHWPDADPAASSGPLLPPGPLVPMDRVEQLLATRSGIDAAERAAIARLLEAMVEALNNDRATGGDRIQGLAGYLRATVDGAALAVRHGHREHILDRLTAGLDNFVATLERPNGAT